MVLSFNDLLLLTPAGEIYGNENVLLVKLGRILLVFERTKGIVCYVLNSSDISIGVYLAQKLKDECLAGTKTCAAAFGIPDKRPLSEEPDVVFQTNLDGSCTITLREDPISLKNGNEFFNVLHKELRDNEGFTTFKDLVEMRETNPIRVKVFIYTGTAPPQKVMETFDVIVNVCTAGSILDAIPNSWDIFYDASSKGIEYNPVLLRLPKENVRPLQIQCHERC